MANDSIEAARKVGLFDAHCHPTDVMSATDQIPHMNARVLTIMATRAQDQDLVETTAQRYPVDGRNSIPGETGLRSVIPSFGWHPWFAHHIYDDCENIEEIDASKHYRAVLTPPLEDEQLLNSLPSPRPLSEYLRATEEKLGKFPLALVGEIGLDRAFRVPYGAFKSPDSPNIGPADMTVKTGGAGEGEYTPGSREGRPLSPHRVSMDHQKIILKAQLELAAKLKRPVSIHSVSTHGVAFDVLQSLWNGYEKPSKSARKKQKNDAPNAVDEADERSELEHLPYPQRICMHSYSGPADALKQYLGPRVPADIFFSFSELVNFGSHDSNKAVDVIKAVPSDKILIESDLHCAGQTMDDLLEKIFVRVCKIKGWKLEEGAIQLRQNWERFIFGVNG